VIGTAERPYAIGQWSSWVILGLLVAAAMLLHHQQKRKTTSAQNESGNVELREYGVQTSTEPMEAGTTPGANEEG
jgi:hypothetical protein